MRKGLSLIELVFTIVIIAVVFIVIPKIVFALNKSDEFSIKQDALFNGMTLMQMITHLSWDENSTSSNDILQTASSNFSCNSTLGNYRIGGFRGSRNCENNVNVFGPLGHEASEVDKYLYNDIDDFNAIDFNTSKYRLHVDVKYIADTFAYSGQNAKITLNNNAILTSTNLKYIDINISYQGNKTALHGNTISQFSFVSANIGKFFISKRAW
ncbi:MAG: hypothetical protein PHN18_05780 [Sulfurospirillaceae bacterium]|nr:hypothetical protein [Sulfurospirillaceae bacterium]MDD2825821.1 hypothetical protein [Sulfurospirillaceae bacterium]